MGISESLGHVLALDTATPFASVTVTDGSGAILDSRITGERESHNETLAKTVTELWNEFEIQGDSVSVVVGLGPGSFTGLRIGLSYAIGVAAACGIPLWGVSTHGAVALQEASRSKNGIGLSHMDARREERFYCEAYGETVSNAPALGTRTAVLERARVLASEGGISTNLDEMVTVSEAIAWCFVNVRHQCSRFQPPSFDGVEPLYVREVSARTIAERSPVRSV